MTIEEQIRLDNPFFVLQEEGVETIISPDTNPTLYEAMIAERVLWATETRNRSDEENQAILIRRRVKNARSILAQISESASGSSNLTQAQIKNGFLRLSNIMDDIILVMIRQYRNDGE